MSFDRDLVSTFQRILIPSPMSHGIRRSHFKGPMPDVAFVICDIQIGQTMGIGPVESGYCSRQQNRFLHVVVRNAVVCRDRTRSQRKTSGHQKETKYTASHETPPALAVS